VSLLKTTFFGWFSIGLHFCGILDRHGRGWGHIKSKFQLKIQTLRAATSIESRETDEWEKQWKEKDILSHILWD